MSTLAMFDCRIGNSSAMIIQDARCSMLAAWPQHTAAQRWVLVIFGEGDSGCSALTDAQPSSMRGAAFSMRHAGTPLDDNFSQELGFIYCVFCICNCTWFMRVIEIDCCVRIVLERYLSTATTTTPSEWRASRFLPNPALV